MTAQPRVRRRQGMGARRSDSDAGMRITAGIHGPAAPPGRGPVGEAAVQVDRRTFVGRMLVSAVGVSAAGLLAACGGEDEQRPRMSGPMSPDMGGTGMPDWMMDRGPMDAQMRQDMRVIHGLLVNHEKIRRQVDDIPDGIRSVSVSEDSAVAELIRTHVRQMKARIERGDPIRQMDPLFREIFEHHEAISMAIEQVRGGVRVTETSPDPRVELLIRQHAHRAVSEFVAAGMQRAMRPTPLPPRYRD